MMFVFRFLFIALFGIGVLFSPNCLANDFIEEDGDFEIFDEESVVDEDTQIDDGSINVETDDENVGNFIPEGEIAEMPEGNIAKDRDNYPVVASVELFNKLKYGQKVRKRDIEGWLYNTTDVNECLENGKTMLLQMVSKSSDIESISLLIDNDADLETNCEPKYNALFVAAQNNMSGRVIDLLITKGADLVVKDYEGNNALLIASAYNPSADVIEVLLEYGLKINAQNNLGMNSLMLAAHQNSIEVVKELLQNGADVNLKDKKGRTALMAAAVRGDDDVMQLLIRYGAEFEVVDNANMSVLDYYNKNKYLKDNDYQESEFFSPSEKLEHQYQYITNKHYQYNDSLKKAVFEDDAEEKVRQAIEGKADINSLDSNGCTPLINAARNDKSYKVFELLLENGAMVNAKCIEDLTALMLVSSLAQGNDRVKEEIEKLKLLKEYGVDVNAVDKGNNNALMYAINSGADVNYVMNLLSIGADVNSVNKDGDTPLFLALKRKSPQKVLEVLISSGANLNYKHPKDWTPLWYLINNNESLDKIILLLESGADTSVVNKIGKTPLWHLLLNGGNAELLNALIKFDKNLNKPDARGDTPLLFAVKNDYPTEVVKTLLQYGADPEYKDSKGKNAMDIIAESQFFDITIEEQVRNDVLKHW